MKYPEFCFVEVAVNGAHNRNKIFDITKLGDPIEKKLTDTYQTYFRYPQEMVDYVKTGIITDKGLEHTVKGYPGPAYSDFIPIDIDTNDLNLALQESVRAMEILQTYDVDLNVCKLYFSGSKGFHILIPTDLIGVEPCTDIHQLYRGFIKRLMVGVKVDSSIYDKVRIFRIPNTINSKSGKYKIRLYPFELYNSSAEDIVEMAKVPREEWEPEEPEVNEELSALFYQKDKEPRTNQTLTTGVKVKLCMQKIMLGVSEGERDNAALRVAVHLKYSGLSPDMIWSALNEWNLSNKPSLTDRDLERVYRQGLQNYEFGCRDFLLSAYCDKKCLFYKEGR